MTKPLIEPTFAGAAAPRRTSIGRARAGAPRPVGFAEGLRTSGIETFGGERVDLPAVEIGERIRAARQMRGLTQGELANLVGCRQADLSDIELGKGRHGPRYSTLVKLARGLEIELPINPRPGPDFVTVESAEPHKVNQSTGNYGAFDPLLTIAERSGLQKALRAYVLKERGLVQDSRCYLVSVEPDAKACFRLETRIGLLMALRGSGKVRVKKATHRFPAKADPCAPLAILNPGSEVEIETHAGEGMTFMMVPMSAPADDLDVKA